MPSVPRILLIDDHALFRSGLRMVLSAALHPLEVSEAASLEAALRVVGEPPDLLLVDVQLQGLSGLEAIAPLRQRWPRAAVVMLSSHADPDRVQAALARGAAAFVSKEATADHIVAVVAPLLRGEPAPPALRVPGAPASGGDGTPVMPRLTPRQCEVLDLLCQGLSNKVIGRRLDLSENTVRGHVQAMLAALQVSSRSEAVFVARRCGLVH